MRATVRRGENRRAHESRSIPERSLRRAVRVGVVLALVAIGCFAALASADVRGTLTIPSDLAPLGTAEEATRARYWEEWNGVLDARTRRVDATRELAVVLTGGPASDGEQPPYRLHNGALAPATIVARAGAAIQIRNDDGMPYELFAEGSTDFAATQTAPGNARPITMPGEPGHWPVRDRIHPHVQGHLHVLPDLVARAFVEPNGAYTFRGVAPGTYRLRVFHGPRELTTQEVVVPEGGQLTVPAIQLSAAPTAAATPAAAGDAVPAAGAAPAQP